jgi:hypothetical protein
VDSSCGSKLDISPGPRLGYSTGRDAKLLEEGANACDVGYEWIVVVGVVVLLGSGTQCMRSVGWANELSMPLDARILVGDLIPVVVEEFDDRCSLQT